MNETSMTTWEGNPNIKLLTEREVRPLLDSQLALFTRESIHADEIAPFDIAMAVEALRDKENQKVVGADFGGDKGTSQLFEVKNGILVPIDGYRDEVQGDDGKGYVESLIKTGRYAEDNSLPFGITWGGPLEGTKPLFHPKATVFIDELGAQFGGDISNISSNIKAVINDGPAGLIASAVEAYRQFKSTDVIFAINGGGLGLSVLKDGILYSTEAGHVEGIAELNAYNQSDACGVFDAQFTCIERLGANKAGIEAQWQAITGVYMRARDIEDRYKEGNVLAGDLYENSAYVVAHMIQGAANAFGIDLNSPTSVVVGHGGAFKFPHYGERIQQLLSSDPDATVQLLMTKDFSDPKSNACLDGVAISALLK